MPKARIVVATLVLALVGALTTSPPALGADPTPADRETTRALLATGDSLAAQKDFAGALQAYEGAAAIIAVPTTVIEVARTQEALGRLVEARDGYLRVTRMVPAPGEPAPFAAARAEAGDLAAKVAPRIPSVIVAVKNTSQNPATPPTVTVDGVEVPAAAALLPRKVNPGKHVLLVTLAGYKEARAEVNLAESEARTVEIALEVDPNAVVAPPAPGSPATASTGGPRADDEGSRTLMIVGFAAGGAGFAFGSIFGLMSLSRASDARQFCNDGDHCTGEAQHHIDASITLANASDIGFAVALVGAGVGIYALLTEPKKRATALWVTPFGARGTF